MTTRDLTFSLVINTTDRADPLRTLLRTLEHQSYPHFEVVVVVGPTHDNTLDVLSEYEGRVRVWRCTQANLSQSRNIGLLAARGDIVAYIDDDAVPCTRWFEQLARLFENPCLDATGGVVYLVHPHRPMVQHRIGIVSSLAEHVDVRSSWLEHVVPPGAGCQWVTRMMGTNMAVRRQTLLEIGGFDEFYIYIAEETDMAMRLVNAGKIVHPVKETAVYHVPASSRHRVAFSYTGRWWLQTRSGIYFAIKNGLAAGDSIPSIVVRCLQHVHGHWLWYRSLWQGGELTASQALKLSVLEMWGAIIGTSGWLRPRQLVQPPRESETKLPILVFQTGDSAKQPTVDPISGHRPAISLPEPPLRICLLSGSYPPAQIGGIGRHTHLMAQGLFECGHAVHVVAHGDREQIAFYDGAYVHRIPYRLDRYGPYRQLINTHHALNYSHAVYEKVRRLMLNDGVQVVDSPLWQLEGLVTAVSQVAPVVLRLQTSLRQIAALQRNRDPDARLMGELEQAFLQQAAYLVPNSQATLEAVQKVYGVAPPDGRYLVVPHGIVPVPDDDICPFDPKRAADTRTILYVGRLEKRKGILDLFAAIPLVLKRAPEARFVIVGGDNSRHDGFQGREGIDYPTYFAQRYGEYAAHVEFKGEVDDEALQRFYQSCDLFVAPSLYESFGLIYLEAMNYAKPVIGCQAGGVPEVVEHGVTGLLVEPEAPAALAEAIVALIQSPARLRDMGLAGRARLLEKFTYIQMARQFERVYRTVIRTWDAATPESPTGG